MLVCVFTKFTFFLQIFEYLKRYSKIVGTLIFFTSTIQNTNTYIYMRIVGVYASHAYIYKCTIYYYQFKQWSDFVEPRHELDFPIITSNDESLQKLPLPDITISSDLDVNKYQKIVLTTKVMNPLFHSIDSIESNIIGYIES